MLVSNEQISDSNPCVNFFSLQTHSTLHTEALIVVVKLVILNKNRKTSTFC